jgi:uncharacterized membrane protein
MKWRSARAVLVGVIVVIVGTTLVDIVLHATGVFPPMDQPLNDALSALATSYRVALGIGAAWLTARLAPARPMRHAMILGAIGLVLALVGVVATWNLGLGPRWYPILLAVLALPQSWCGGRLCQIVSGRAQATS